MKTLFTWEQIKALLVTCVFIFLIWIIVILKLNGGRL